MFRSLGTVHCFGAKPLKFPQRLRVDEHHYILHSWGYSNPKAYQPWFHITGEDRFWWGVGSPTACWPPTPAMMHGSWNDSLLATGTPLLTGCLGWLGSIWSGSSAGLLLVALCRARKSPGENGSLRPESSVGWLKLGFQCRTLAIILLWILCMSRFWWALHMMPFFSRGFARLGTTPQF